MLGGKSLRDIIPGGWKTSGQQEGGTLVVVCWAHDITVLIESWASDNCPYKDCPLDTLLWILGAG